MTFSAISSLTKSLNSTLLSNSFASIIISCKRLKPSFENATDKEIAETVQPFFTDINLDVLIEVVNRYRSINAWCKTPMFSKEGFNRLQDIMIEAKELDSKVEFNDLVRLDIAEKVIKDEK